MVTKRETPAHGFKSKLEAQGGTVPLSGLGIVADDEGIAWRTVERAKGAMHVALTRAGGTA